MLSPAAKPESIALTPGQINILDRFATIEAEMGCVLREIRRAAESLQRKPKRNKKPLLPANLYLIFFS
jgi:hypothetical protein